MRKRIWDVKGNGHRSRNKNDNGNNGRRSHNHRSYASVATGQNEPGGKNC
jgi:hypothetical protein